MRAPSTTSVSTAITARERAPPSPRHRRGRRRDDRRRRRQRPVRVARRGAVRPLCGSLAARPRDLGKLADRPRRRRRERGSSRRANPRCATASSIIPSFGGEPGLFILTNADGAEDFKIAWAPLAASGRDHWRDVVPHRPGVYILSFTVFAGWLIRLEREDGLARIVVRRLADGEEHTIAFDEEAYSLGFDPGYEFATDTLRFSYSSMTTPSEIWDYDLGARTRRLRKRQEIPSGHDPAAYVTRRLFAPAPDGETVPVSLLYRKGTPLDGTAPALVYGYGAYGMSIPAAFTLQPAVARRPRLRRRDRPCARRHREGLALVPRRKAREEAEHVFRLHRRDGISDRARNSSRRTRSSPTAHPRAAC